MVTDFILRASAQVAMHEGDDALHGFGGVGTAGVADNKAFNLVWVER
jgi:hypothetical protein